MESFSHSQEDSYEILNQTMTLLLLSEDSDKYADNEDTYVNIEDSNRGIDALTNLVSISTKELSDMNDELEKQVAVEVEKNVEKDQQLLPTEQTCSNRRVDEYDSSPMETTNMLAYIFYQHSYACQRLN